MGGLFKTRYLLIVVVERLIKSFNLSIRIAEAICTRMPTYIDTYDEILDDNFLYISRDIKRKIT